MTKKILIALLFLTTSLVTTAEQTQTVILNPLPQPQNSPCGYFYNGNEQTNDNSATFTQNNNYSTQTYSTAGKNPYPYYGTACQNNNGNASSVIIIPPSAIGQ